MPSGERGGLKAAFTNFQKQTDEEAERKLLGRTIGKETPPETATTSVPDSYQQSTPGGGLIPRPLLQREAVRQLSFRCPVSVAAVLRKKAAFNQLEQQEIIVEGLKRVLAELPDPPAGWENS